jgi:hypothetical protein
MVCLLHTYIHTYIHTHIHMRARTHTHSHTRASLEFITAVMLKIPSLRGRYAVSTGKNLRFEG